MKATRIYFKHLAAIFMLIVLLVPLIESTSGLQISPPLQGDTTRVRLPEMSLQGWWNADYQEQSETYLNKRHGCRSLCIRILNQLRYWIFARSSAPGVVVARNGDLLVEAYIDEYTGKNFTRTGRIHSVAKQLKQVQDSLKARGTALIVVFAPGKASYDPDQIPAAYLEEKKDSSNYLAYKAYLESEKVNFLDLNSWFRSIKQHTPHKLYPRYGAHWNQYGMALALDTILKFIENLCHIDMPEFKYEKVSYSSNLSDNDFDIGVLMNTLLPIKKDENPYPEFSIHSHSLHVKPSVLVVGDSYWWTIVGEHLPERFFASDEYWFYNRDRLINNTKCGRVEEQNLHAALRNRKVVLLVSCEATYHLFPFGFAEQVHKLYCEDHSKRLKEITAAIYNNAASYNKVLGQAATARTGPEVEVRDAAEYRLCEELFNTSPDLDSLIRLIRVNPAWMKDIETKAARDNIGVEEQIRLDAAWYIHNQRNKQKL